MRAVIILCALLAGFNASAQNYSKQANPIQYLGSSSEKGSSDAVIVENVPLVHTKQFLPHGKNGRIVKGNFKVQTEQVFQNINQSLNESGSKSDQIIKLNVFLTSINLISDFQLIVSQRFDKSKQPSITYAIGELANPDALIAVDAIAVSNFKSDRVKTINKNVGDGASSAILPAGPVVYVSGQAAKGDLAQATHATLKQLSETLTSLGLSFKDVVQIKSFLTPMSSLSLVKKQFANFFNDEIIPPLVFVDWISADPVIEIELIASSPLKVVKAPQIDYITPPGMASSPVYSKVSRLNYGRKVYLSGLYGTNSGNSDSEVSNLFDSMRTLLSTSGSDFNHLLKATYYITNNQYSKSLGDLRPKYYDPQRPPAASKAMIKAVGLDGRGIAVDMIGTVKE